MFTWIANNQIHELAPDEVSAVSGGSGANPSQEIVCEVKDRPTQEMVWGAFGTAANS